MKALVKPRNVLPSAMTLWCAKRKKTAKKLAIARQLVQLYSHVKNARDMMENVAPSTDLLSSLEIFVEPVAFKHDTILLQKFREYN